MKGIFIEKQMLIAIIALIVVLIIGMTKIERYNYYAIPSIDTETLNDVEVYSKINDQVIYDEDCLCILTFSTYKALEGFDEYDLYTVHITIEINQNDDLSTKTVSEFNSISKVSVKTDVSTNETGILLSEYLMTDWSNHKKGWDVSFSLNNLLGKKDLSASLNNVGYMHSDSNSVEGIYNGEFTYQEYITDSKVQTKYSIAVPKADDDTIVANIFTFNYRIEMLNSKIYPFSITHRKITGEWKEVTLVFGN